MWGEGAFAELRALLPEDHVVARQVALRGLARVVRGDDAGAEHERPCRTTAPSPTHFLAAFGPRPATCGARPPSRRSTSDAQRAWVRQRESRPRLPRGRAARAEAGPTRMAGRVRRVAHATSTSSRTGSACRAPGRRSAPTRRHPGGAPSGPRVGRLDEGRLPRQRPAALGRDRRRRRARARAAHAPRLRRRARARARAGRPALGLPRPARACLSSRSRRRARSSSTSRSRRGGRPTFSLFHVPARALRVRSSSRSRTASISPGERRARSARADARPARALHHRGALDRRHARRPAPRRAPATSCATASTRASSAAPRRRRAEPADRRPLRVLVEGNPRAGSRDVHEAIAAVARCASRDHLTVVDRRPRRARRRRGADGIVGPRVRSRRWRRCTARATCSLKLSSVEGMYGPPLEAFHGARPASRRR